MGNTGGGFAPGVGTYGGGAPNTGYQSARSAGTGGYGGGPQGYGQPVGQMGYGGGQYGERPHAAPIELTNQLN